VAELREQELPDAKINRIVKQLIRQDVESEQQLLHGLQRCPDEQLLANFMQGGFKYGPALALATAIQKILPPAEPERRLSPRDAGMCCSLRICFEASICLDVLVFWRVRDAKWLQASQVCNRYPSVLPQLEPASIHGALALSILQCL
jgi:hypothetical protein